MIKPLRRTKKNTALTGRHKALKNAPSAFKGLIKIGVGALVGFKGLHAAFKASNCETITSSVLEHETTVVVTETNLGEEVQRTKITFSAVAIKKFLPLWLNKGDKEKPGWRPAEDHQAGQVEVICLQTTKSRPHVAESSHTHAR